MKIMTARRWYGEGTRNLAFHSPMDGIVIKTDNYLIDLYISTKFLWDTFYSPRTSDDWGESYILALGWLRIEITEDDIIYWEDM